MLQSWLLQKPTFNQKQRPLQCSLEASSPFHHPLCSYKDRQRGTFCLKCVSVRASLCEAMFGCCFVELCLTGARVKISNHFFFLLSATALIGGVWAVSGAPCGGRLSKDWLRWKSNRVSIPAQPCRHWSNVNIVAEHSLIIYPATENLSTSFIAPPQHHPSACERKHRPQI